MYGVWFWLSTYGTPTKMPLVFVRTLVELTLHGLQREGAAPDLNMPQGRSCMSLEILLQVEKYNFTKRMTIHQDWTSRSAVARTMAMQGTPFRR